MNLPKTMWLACDFVSFTKGDKSQMVRCSYVLVGDYQEMVKKKPVFEFI